MLGENYIRDLKKGWFSLIMASAGSLVVGLETGYSRMGVVEHRHLPPDSQKVGSEAGKSLG